VVLTFARRALEAVLVVFVLGVLALAVAAQAAPLAGHGLYAVRSASMMPALAIGDLVVARRADPAEIRTGEVVTITVGGRTTVTHRVVAVTPTDDGPVFRMQGDANATADPVAARADQVRGLLVVQLPLLGFLLAMLSMPSGIAALFSIGATLLTAIWLLDEIADGDDEDELDDLAWQLDAERARAGT
jgi:signal peptidase I